MPNLLTTSQTAQLLSCSQSTLAKYRLTGDGPPFVKFGSTVRYRIEDLEKWTDKRLRRSTSNHVSTTKIDPTDANGGVK